MIKLNGKELEQRFNQLLECDTFTCTSEEFDLFMNYGLLLKSGKSFVTRNNTKVNVQVIQQKVHTMSINLSGLISNCIEMCKVVDTNKIFCMSAKTLSKYEKQGLIIEKNNIKYYRLYNNELWAVYLI